MSTSNYKFITALLNDPKLSGKIKDDTFGQMIKEYDSDRWASGVLRYLEDEEYTRKVKDNCKALIREQYTWDTITAKMLSFINS